jgi:hypothetical protein
VVSLGWQPGRSLAQQCSLNNQPLLATGVLEESVLPAAGGFHVLKRPTSMVDTSELVVVAKRSCVGTVNNVGKSQSDTLESDEVLQQELDSAFADIQ